MTRRVPDRPGRDAGRRVFPRRRSGWPSCVTCCANAGAARASSARGDGADAQKLLHRLASPSSKDDVARSQEHEPDQRSVGARSTTLAAIRRAGAYGAESGFRGPSYGPAPGPRRLTMIDRVCASPSVAHGTDRTGGADHGRQADRRGRRHRAGARRRRRRAGLSDVARRGRGDRRRRARARPARRGAAGRPARARRLRTGGRRRPSTRSAGSTSWSTWRRSTARRRSTS